MNKRKKKRKTLRQTYSPLGRSLILAGAAVMAVCAVWECAVRLDSMDGVLGAYFDLVRELDASLSVALRVLFQNGEAVRDLAAVIYIATTGIFSVFAFLLRKKTVACALMLPACVYMLIKDTGGDSLVQTLNLFRAIRASCAAAILAGACLNAAFAVYAWFENRKSAKKRGRKNANATTPRERRLSHGTYKTLIPRRETARRSGSVGRNG